MTPFQKDKKEEEVARLRNVGVLYNHRISWHKTEIRQLRKARKRIMDQIKQLESK